MASFTWPLDVSGGAVVVGPGSSTNNAFPRWSGTTGNLLKDSPVICDDSGNLTGIAALTASGRATLTGTVSGTLQIGATSTIFVSNERVRFKMAATSGQATQSSAVLSLQLDDTYDVAITNQHRAIVANYVRTVTTGTTDTGGYCVYWARPDFSASGVTLTNNNATMGYSTFQAAAPALAAGTLAISNYAGFYCEATSLVTGAAGNKYGMYIGAQTGANGANYGLYVNGASGATTNAAVFVNSGNVVLGGGALATNATSGFTYIPGGAGTPTGTPDTFTGAVPLYVDTTNHKLYFYSGGAWRDAGP